MLKPNEKDHGCPDVQADIYRLALSLDSLFVNGVQFGIFQPTLSNGLLEKLSGALLKDVETVHQDIRHAPPGEQHNLQATYEALRTELADLTDLVGRLVSFQLLALTDLRDAVSRLVCQREEGVRLINALETCFQTAQPFYATRSREASAAVERFVADLPRRFEAEWHGARSDANAPSVGWSLTTATDRD